MIRKSPSADFGEWMLEEALASGLGCNFQH